MCFCFAAPQALRGENGQVPGGDDGAESALPEASADLRPVDFAGEHEVLEPHRALHRHEQGQGGLDIGDAVAGVHPPGCGVRHISQ